MKRQVHPVFKGTSAYRAHGTDNLMRVARHMAICAAALACVAPVATMAQLQISQIQIQQSTVVRIKPAQSQLGGQAETEPMRWNEKKGPDCIQTNSLAGAMVTSTDSIDLLLRGGTRLRARLAKSCPAIDFYQGFYVKPSKDGRICKDRDIIRSRSGGECEIDKFKQLVPAK